MLVSLLDHPTGFPRSRETTNPGSVFLIGEFTVVFWYTRVVITFIIASCQCVYSIGTSQRGSQSRPRQSQSCARFSSEAIPDETNQLYSSPIFHPPHGGRGSHPPNTRPALALGLHFEYHGATCESLYQKNPTRTV